MLHLISNIGYHHSMVVLLINLPLKLKYLNIWFPIAGLLGDVWGEHLGGGGLLEEVHHKGERSQPCHALAVFSASCCLPLHTLSQLFLL